MGLGHQLIMCFGTEIAFTGYRLACALFGALCERGRASGGGGEVPHLYPLFRPSGHSMPLNACFAVALVHFGVLTLPNHMPVR
jgi:hypothetical protein